MGFKAAAIVGVLLIVPALAHDVATGPNGGRVVEAPPHHLELVVKGHSVAVFVTDAGHNSLSLAGFKGVAILTAGGKVARVTLEGREATRLSGVAAIELPADVTGVVQLTGPDGKILQGHFR